MTDRIDIQLKMYEQLCTSYRAIDDFRAKLLGFLPLVSGSGIFILLNESVTEPNKRHVTLQFLSAIGSFGFVVTIGLFFYELYGIRKCHALIEAGRRLECSLDIEDGQFRRRPRSVLQIINEPFAAGVIYPAVWAAWLFLALIPHDLVGPSAGTGAPLPVAICVFISGCALTLAYNLLLAKGQPSYLYQLFLE